MPKPTAALVVAGLVLVSVRAPDAHHSVAMFDTATPIVVKGIVKRVERVNPHSLVYVEQTTADGGRVTWAVEGPQPARLNYMGVFDDTLAEGHTVEARGYALKTAGDGPPPERRLLVAEVFVTRDGKVRLWSPYGLSHCREQKGYANAE